MTLQNSPGDANSGPFATEEQARKAAHRVVRPEPGWSILRAGGNRELLRLSLDAAGVATGAYDDRILEWLGTFGDGACAVVAGWVTRAAAGKPDDGDAPRCAQCGGSAEQYPDPYADRMLWRHRLPQGLADVASFLDGEHEAAPAGAL